MQTSGQQPRAIRPLSLAIVALALFVAPACTSIGARAFNVREMHEDDGHHRLVAVQMDDTEYLFQRGFLALFKKDPSSAKAPSQLEDPLETCVENLLALSDINPERENLAALQVEYFARYSAIDPWQISRQICLRQLGRAGSRLKLAKVPPPAEQNAELATPDSLREALAPLVKAMLPRSNLEAPGDVAAACAGIAKLRYDLDGCLRALAASAALLDRMPANAKDRTVLLRLVLDLERRTVRLALERGISDKSSHVRAAAAEALVRANGSVYLQKLLPRLISESEEEVPIAILAMIREQGLPPAQPVTQGARDEQLALVYDVATKHPIGRVRVAAMQALGAIAGAGFESLREEDWDAWWHKRPGPVSP